jgi:hypothetical protein
MADIRHSIQIAAKPEAIYLLFATAKGFAEWWAADVTESAGAVELGFFKRATVYRLKLKENAPPMHAEWICETGDEWKETRIDFRLEERGSLTVVSFAHRDWRSESAYFISCNTTWGELMFRLKAAAEGRKPGPLFRAEDMAY